MKSHSAALSSGPRAKPAGGNILLQSAGDVIARTGSAMDVSGGSVAFQPGYGQTTKLLGANGNPALAQQVTPLIGQVSVLEQQLLAKYGQGVTGQISVAIAKAVYNGIVVGLAGLAGQ